MLLEVNMFRNQTQETCLVHTSILTRDNLGLAAGSDVTVVFPDLQQTKLY